MQTKSNFNNLIELCQEYISKHNPSRLKVVDFFKNINVISEVEKKDEKDGDIKNTKKTKHKYIIAIDFDGTIVENKHPEIGKIRTGAKKYINKLFEDGHTIIIWTCRTDEDEKKAKEFLEENEIRFSKINENATKIKKMFKTGPKIYADIYIDDRNITGIPEWKMIYELVNKWNPDKVL